MLHFIKIAKIQSLITINVQDIFIKELAGTIRTPKGAIRPGIAFYTPRQSFMSLHCLDSDVKQFTFENENT